MKIVNEQGGAKDQSVQRTAWFRDLAQVKFFRSQYHGTGTGGGEKRSIEQAAQPDGPEGEIMLHLLRFRRSTTVPGACQPLWPSDQRGIFPCFFRGMSSTLFCSMPNPL